MKIKFLFTLLILLTFSNIFAQSLPPVDLQYASYAVSSDDKLIGYFGEKNRVEVKSLKNISKYVVWSLIATEDRDFYNHDGVSYKGLGRAVIQTLTGSTQGGSTITMQLARNLYLSHERSISRKLNEINIAKELEKKYSKDEILLLYLNTVYFGKGAWGIWAAAQEYFSKKPDKLTITESATLVGLLQSPNGYDPTKNPEKTLKRRNEVLYNLVEVGKISEKEYNKLKSQSLNLKMRKRTGRHFLEHIRKEANSILAKKGISLNKDQIEIMTTLNYDMQEAADEAVEAQWENFPANMKEAQVGLISIEPGTGKIRAMVGGNPESEARGLNHADEIKRQPGSSFKPFLYAKLLEDGKTLAAPVLDAPISITDSITGQTWSPSNSDNNFRNASVPISVAIQHSINTAAAYAITNLTCPDSVVNFAHRCGITSEIPAYPSIALGTAEVSPLEIASATAVFPAYGIYAKPYSITQIIDDNGKTLYRNSIDTVTVLDSATSFLITDALKAVVDSGTARSVRKYYNGIAAGKTGTTQNSTDAWFIGYNKKLCTAIWIGFDNPNRKLNGGFQYGGSACAPIWGRMMNQISKKVKGFAYSDFEMPMDIDQIELCVDSGETATPFCPNKKIYNVNFLKLQNSCHIHSGTMDLF